MNYDVVYNSLSSPIQRPQWPRGLPQKIWDEQNGICYHCKIQLPPRDETPRKYDIDHHPIPFRDIADNCCPHCCIDVSDPLERNNLVATHVVCNRSHTYEKSSSMYCGHAQCFCPRRKCCWGIWLSSLFIIGVGIGLSVYSFII